MAKKKKTGVSDSVSNLAGKVKAAAKSTAKSTAKTATKNSTGGLISPLTVMQEAQKKTAKKNAATTKSTTKTTAKSTAKTATKNSTGGLVSPLTIMQETANRKKTGTTIEQLASKVPASVQSAAKKAAQKEQGTTYPLSGYDRTLGTEQQKAISFYKRMWDEANRKGDAAKKATANRNANTIRETYGGYNGGTSGLDQVFTEAYRDWLAKQPSKHRTAEQRINDTAQAAIAGMFAGPLEAIGQFFNPNSRGYNPSSRYAREGDMKSAVQEAEASRQIANRFFQEAEEFSNKQQKDTEQAKAGLGKAGRLAVDVGIAGGQMLGDLALNAAAPGAGLANLAVRAFGQGAQEARLQGASAEQQAAYGLAVSAVETATEKLFNTGLFRSVYGSGLKTGKKTLDDIAGSAVSKLVKNKRAAQIITSSATEGMEEVIADAANPIVRSIYNGKTPLENYREETLSDWLYDGLVGSILGAAGGAVSNQQVGRKVMQNDTDGSAVQSILSDGLSKPEETAGYQAAKAVQETMQNGNIPSQEQIGELVRTNATATEKSGVLAGEVSGVKTERSILNHGEDSQNESEKRTAGVGAGEQTGILAEGTEGVGLRQTADTEATGTGRPDFSGFVWTGRSTTAKDLNIRGGTGTKKAVLLDEDDIAEVPYLADLKQQLNERGVGVQFVAGSLSVSDGIGEGEIRGYFDPESEEIVVQIDDEESSPVQVANHELFHNIVYGDPSVVSRIRTKIRELYGPDTFRKMVDAYVRDYGGIYEEAEAIEEEMLADAFAGMNDFGSETFREEITGLVREETETETGEKNLSRPFGAPSPKGRAGATVTEEGNKEGAEAGRYSRQRERREEIPNLRLKGVEGKAPPKFSAKDSEKSGRRNRAKDGTISEGIKPGQQEYRQILSARMQKYGGKSDIPSVDYVFAHDNFYVVRNYEIDSFSVLCRMNPEVEKNDITLAMEVVNNGNYKTAAVSGGRAGGLRAWGKSDFRDSRSGEEAGGRNKTDRLAEKESTGEYRSDRESDFNRSGEDSGTLTSGKLPGKFSLKSFPKQLDDYERGIFPKNDTFLLGETPEVLQKIGFLPLPMVMNQRHINAALNGTYKGSEEEKRDHIIPRGELEQLPEKIAHPVAVIQDKRIGKKTPSESVVDVLIEMTINGKQALAPVRVDGQGRYHEIEFDANVATTAHGNRDSIPRLVDAIKSDTDENPTVYYMDKEKAIETLQRAGNPIPSALHRLNGYVHSITDENAPVKHRFQSVTETQQFRRWFGDSVVTNEDGSPKVVYHGTDQDFTVFESRDGTFWFSEDEDYAEAMMEERGGGSVMECYLSIQNPYRAKLAPGKFTDPTFERPIIQKAKAEGHDGVIIEADTDNWLEKDTFYVAFRPEQIKSATDNIGLFDPDNPDIRYSRKKKIDYPLHKQFEKWKEKSGYATPGNVDREAVRKAVRRLARRLKAGKADVEGITDRLTKLFDTASYHGMTYQELLTHAAQVAEELVYGAEERETGLYDQYRDLRKFLRGNTFSIRPEDVEIADFKDFRKRNFGRLNLREGDRTNIDVLFEEMKERWPEFFQNDTMNVNDQLLRMEEVADQIFAKPAINPHKGAEKETVQEAAEEIIRIFLSVKRQETSLTEEQRGRFTDPERQTLSRMIQRIANRVEETMENPGIDKMVTRSAVSRMADEYLATGRISKQASEREFHRVSERAEGRFYPGQSLEEFRSMARDNWDSAVEELRKTLSWARELVTAEITDDTGDAFGKTRDDFWKEKGFPVHTRTYLDGEGREQTVRKQLYPGQWVKAYDRGNYGKIIGRDGNRLSVLFVNPERGSAVTLSMGQDEFMPVDGMNTRNINSLMETVPEMPEVFYPTEEIPWTPLELEENLREAEEALLSPEERARRQESRDIKTYREELESLLGKKLPPMNEKEKRPMTLDNIREIAAEHGIELETRDLVENPALAEMTAVQLKAGKGGNYNRDLARNLDDAAGKDRGLRENLFELFERPLFEAKDGYTKGVKDALNTLEKEVVKGLGIQPGTRESAAVQWYGEGEKYGRFSGVDETAEDGKVPFHEDDLRREFPTSWKKIMEAEKIFRRVYDGYLEKINRSMEKIYPSVTERANADIEKYRATARYYYEKSREQEAFLETAKRKLEVQKERLDKETDAERAAKLSHSVWYQSRRVERIEKRVLKYRENGEKANTVAGKIAHDVETGEILRGKRIIPRKDYFHHFQEMEQGFDALKNIITTPSDISSSLAGQSEFTKPLTKWAGFMQRRNGKRVMDADAVGGMLRYIPMAEFKIHLDPYVARGRDLARIFAKATELTRNANSFLTWYTDWLNDISGKTNPMDRFTQKLMDRKIMKVLEWLNNRVKSNAIVGNVRTAFAQFFNLPNATYYLQNPTDWGRSLPTAIHGLFGQGMDNEVMKQSPFLRERYELDPILKRMENVNAIRKNLEKLTDFLLTAGDEAVTRWIWSAAYTKAMREDHADPILYADDIARRSVAGRGIGEIPMVQSARLTKFIAPFQVEVNNQWQIVKDAVRAVLGKNSSKRENAKAATGILWMLAVSFGMNAAARWLFGSDVSMDLINAFLEALGDRDEEENELQNVFNIFGRVAGELVSNVPFGTQIAGFLVADDTNREKFFGDEDPTRFGTGNIGINMVMDPLIKFLTGQDFSDDLLSAGLNIALPFGGKQTSRAIKALQIYGVLPEVYAKTEGVSAYRQKGGGASYNGNEKLRFAVDSDPLSIVQTAAFGPFATRRGKAYTGQALSDKQTEMFRELTENGVKTTEAYDSILAVRELEPDADHTSVTQSQKCLAIAEMPYSEKVRQSMIEATLGDSGSMEKYRAALDSGISTLAYWDFKYHTSGMQSVKDDEGNTVQSKQEQVWAYIDSMEIPTSQKDALHLTLYGETSLKDAPWH